MTEVRTNQDEPSSQAWPTELTLTHLDSLPTLPPVAVQILRTTLDPACGAADVARVIEADQSVAAKLLSVANSALYGAPGQIATIDEAVVRLGFAAVRTLVLSVTVFECFPPAPGGDRRRAFDRAEFWKHALACACLARSLAQEQRALALEPDEAFVAGLLHDLGKVALDAVFPKSYERVAALAEQTRADISECERQMLRIDHTVAGRRIAERWGLPRRLTEVIWLHHLAFDSLPPSVENRHLIALVQLADTLAREQHIGYSGNHAFYERSQDQAAALGIRAEALTATAGRVMAEVAEYTQLLGLTRETPESLFMKSLSRANTELGRANCDLLASNRRLAAAARYFNASMLFNANLSARSELPAVVAAIALAARTALEVESVTAFGVHETCVAMDVCKLEADRRFECTQRLGPEAAAWLRAPGDALTVLVTQLAAPLREALSVQLLPAGDGNLWLLPIVHENVLTGGILLASTRDERSVRNEETTELRAFSSSLGLAISRANAQASARRLSDELAESNRRLTQMQSEVLRSRALSMIAEMAAGAGHELNSPLSVISGRAQMLLQSATDPEQTRILELINAKANECSQIVSELMEFARPAAPTITTVGVLPLLSELRSEWIEERGFPPGRFQLGPIPGAPTPRAAAAPRVLADVDQIKGVLRELLQNAEEATAANQGQIALRWRVGRTRSPAEGAGGERVAVRLPSQWVELVVEDTGLGMGPAVLQRAFDPFFSYRDAGRGRGLGLARAFRVVEAHGGKIWLESRVGEGTTAHVLLPMAPES